MVISTIQYQNQEKPQSTAGLEILDTMHEVYIPVASRQYHQWYPPFHSNEQIKNSKVTPVLSVPHGLEA
jgi:hypothetical protein